MNLMPCCRIMDKIVVSAVVGVPCPIIPICPFPPTPKITKYPNTKIFAPHQLP
jgi:hypothetical protein